MECMRDKFNEGVVLGGRYQTISPLNHGSFGMVFMAKDLESGQMVAVKCLTKRVVADEAGCDLNTDDQLEEIELHKRLGTHPNIVNLVGSFDTDAHMYLVLEFCERGDLYEAIRIGHGPLETEHVRRFMLELVDAVAHMHRKGIYHRDIKPENIFLTQSGSMKLGDFGLATTDKWTFENTVGSDRYMSPEQYDSAGGGYSPAQADIWAIGICLLNILFSRNPFAAPTEADPLFLDFSRDKQSLFDVFPSMSGDTYEVIVQCMNLDPSKRSLAGARDALERVVSFTTDEEMYDDFCSSDRRVIASSNREPLRTPSLQSPQVETGAFPWARALQTSPRKPVRHLSVIADDESYSEDLFSKSFRTDDWLSDGAQTPSMFSCYGSNLGASILSPKLGTTSGIVISTDSSSKVSPMAESLPINMSKSRHQSAMSWLFGRKDAVSKSWSDMWDEDTEDGEQERQDRQVPKQLNHGSWSLGIRKPVTPVTAVDDECTPRIGMSPAIPSSSLHPGSRALTTGKRPGTNIDDDDVADGFFFQELPSPKPEDAQCPMNPPTLSKTNDVDKWAALGERRRAYTGNSFQGGNEGRSSSGQQSDDRVSGSLGNGNGVMDTNNHLHHITHTFDSKHLSSNQASHIAKWNNHVNRDRVKECPRNKGRQDGRDWNIDWRKEKSGVLGSTEWVDASCRRGHLWLG